MINAGFKHIILSLVGINTIWTIPLSPWLLITQSPIFLTYYYSLTRTFFHLETHWYKFNLSLAFVVGHIEKPLSKSLFWFSRDKLNMRNRFLHFSCLAVNIFNLIYLLLQGNFILKKKIKNQKTSSNVNGFFFNVEES